MTLIPGMSSVRDIFAKLKRDASALDEEVTSDRFFNFVITGYSMIDWVKNVPSIPAEAKTNTAIRSLYDDHWLKICADLANASKHFQLSRHTPIVTSANSTRGFGLGRFGKGGFGLGEENIEVELNDGTKFGCFDLVSGVLSTWNSFLSTHGI